VLRVEVHTSQLFAQWPHPNTPLPLRRMLVDLRSASIPTIITGSCILYTVFYKGGVRRGAGAAAAAAAAVAVVPTPAP
jgi:hypothetical protein